MAIPLLAKVFKFGKKILVPKISKALGFGTDTVEQVLAKAQEIAEKDKEVTLKYMDLEKELRGTYVELKTVFEKVLRSVMYHLITIWACVILTLDAVSKKIELDPKVLVACITIILGRIGYRVYQHYKNDKINGFSL